VAKILAGTMGIVRSRDPTIDSQILDIENKRLLAEIAIAQKAIPNTSVIKMKDSSSFHAQSDVLIKKSLETRKSRDEIDMKLVIEHASYDHHKLS
jgi:hypothetical protein